MKTSPFPSFHRLIRPPTLSIRALARQEGLREATANVARVRLREKRNLEPIRQSRLPGRLSLFLILTRIRQA
jgi:hypothetical protein